MHLILRKIDVAVPCNIKFLDALRDLIIVKFTRESYDQKIKSANKNFKYRAIV